MARSSSRIGGVTGSVLMGSPGRTFSPTSRLPKWRKDAKDANFCGIPPWRPYRYLRGTEPQSVLTGQAFRTECPSVLRFIELLISLFVACKSRLQRVRTRDQFRVNLRPAGSARLMDFSELAAAKSRRPSCRTR